MDTTSTAREYIAGFLSTEDDDTPWVLKNIKKEHYHEMIIVDDQFDQDTIRLKAAYDHILYV